MGSHSGHDSAVCCYQLIHNDNTSKARHVDLAQSFTYYIIFYRIISQNSKDMSFTLKDNSR